MESHPVSLLEWAYQEIRQMLFSGRLAPGEKIVVGQLAEKLSISPTPVKEALNRLVAEGLLDALPRRGFQVKHLSAKEVHDILDCRLMMEVFAARKAVENFKRHPEIRKMMLADLKGLEKVEFHDYVEATRLEQSYHSAIIRLTENQHLITLYNILFGVGFSFYVYASENHPMERHAEAQSEHRQMLEALDRSDVEGLENALRSHLERTIDLYETFSSAFAAETLHN